MKEKMVSWKGLWEAEYSLIFNLDKVKLGGKKDLQEIINHFFCQKDAERIAVLEQSVYTS